MQLEKNLSDDNDEDNNQELEKELCSLMDGLRITTVLIYKIKQKINLKSLLENNDKNH